MSNFSFLFCLLMFWKIVFNITSKHFSIFFFHKHFSNIVIQTSFRCGLHIILFSFQTLQTFFKTQNNFQKLIQTYSSYYFLNFKRKYDNLLKLHYCCSYPIDEKQVWVKISVHASVLWYISQPFFWCKQHLPAIHSISHHLKEKPVI